MKDERLSLDKVASFNQSPCLSCRYYFNMK